MRNRNMTRAYQVVDASAATVTLGGACVTVVEGLPRLT
jgi:hypothetical protein